MPFGEQTRQTLDQVAAMMPIWLDVVIGFVVLWGIFLWLFGSRLLRPSLAMIGLIAAAILGGLFARDMGSNEKVAMVIVGAGVVGAMLVWVTFRLWIAVLLALTAGLIAPAFVLIIEGAAPPTEADQPLREAGRDVVREGMERVGIDDEDADGELRAALDDAQADEAGDDPMAQTRADLQKLVNRAAEAAGQSWDELKRWWAEDIDAGVRWTATIVALMMAITGLIVGLIMPHFSAGLVTSFVGAALVIACVGRLLHRYVPAASDAWPQTPRTVMIVLAIATLVGGGLQWWNHRRAEKDD
jgi:FtsH-binding integral membrane protein